MISARLATNVLYPFRLADGGVLLIDAGPDIEGSWHDLAAQLRASNVALEEVRTVLVTHAHADHAGLAAHWAAEGAQVLCGPADLDALREGAEGYARSRHLREETLRRHGCPPDVLERIASRPRAALGWAACADVEAVEDGATFELDGGGALRVRLAPGHTPGNLVALIEDEAGARTLCSGDTLLPETIPTPGLHFPAWGEGERWPSLPPFLASVEALNALEIERVLPGHGEPVETPQRLFERFEVHHARRASRIRALLEERPDSAFGLARRLFRRLPEERLGQALTEMIGQLDVLVASAEVMLEPDRNGTLVAELDAG
ncbi:MAG: MBL fold metallo-hydrolase [Dehalococcoidia bacterium]